MFLYDKFAQQLFAYLVVLKSSTKSKALGGAGLDFAAAYRILLFTEFSLPISADYLREISGFAARKNSSPHAHCVNYMVDMQQMGRRNFIVRKIKSGLLFGP